MVGLHKLRRLTFKRRLKQLMMSINPRLINMFKIADYWEEKSLFQSQLENLQKLLHRNLDFYIDRDIMGRTVETNFIDPNSFEQKKRLQDLLG